MNFLSVVIRIIQAKEAVLDENGDGSASSTDDYIPHESNCSSDSSFFSEDKELGKERYYRMPIRSSAPYKFKNLTNIGIDQPTLAQISPHPSTSGQRQ